MFLTIVIFVIILAILIFVHEFGHFVVAKKSGMQVDEFGFGFPPRIAGIQKVEGKWRWVWGHKNPLGSNTTPPPFAEASGGTPPILGGDAPRLSLNDMRSSPPIIGGVPRQTGGGGINILLTVPLRPAKAGHPSLAGGEAPRFCIICSNIINRK